jgi:lipoprotein NlpI
MSHSARAAIHTIPRASTFIWLFFSTIFPTVWPLSAATSIEELLAKAQVAFTNGNKVEALALATQAIETDPKSTQGYYFRGRVYETQKEHAKAIADFSQVLKIDSELADVYQRRGSENFKLGRIPESVADFEKFLELTPRWKPHHWQLGIAYYYAGRYTEGKRQFELHQTVNREDVENAVWHYLCVARLAGSEKARSSLIKITNDQRIPMMTVYALFSGKATPEDVLKAAKVEAPFPVAQQKQLFYANFYIGLYYEAAGREDLARDYISRAVPQGFRADYMGDVARVHAEILQKRVGKSSGPPPTK